MSSSSPSKSSKAAPKPSKPVKNVTSALKDNSTNSNSIASAVILINSGDEEWLAKRHVWVREPNSEQGCQAASIVGEDQGLITVLFQDGEKRTVSSEFIDPMNPPKFEKVDDMADMSFLNESTVLHNLRERYYSSLIYTYSGLFLVAINPWKLLPLYTDEIVSLYKGRRRNEVPPHIFALCDEAYRFMVSDGENQSILITGETGAGKTENTKKVIQYLTILSSGSGESDRTQLEQRILVANPILEAFGNAKTLRNNNSSRFGKLVKLMFDINGLIVGANIENYLLEKSRVVSRPSNEERSFHVFYQLLSGHQKKEEILLSNADEYNYLKGTSIIDGINDETEFQETLRSMQTLGFGEDECDNIWKLLSATLLFGNITFSAGSGASDDGAILAEQVTSEKICHLLGIRNKDFVTCLLRPRVKAGNTFITTTVTTGRAESSCHALAMSIYERMFRWLVTRVNDSLQKSSFARSFIGVLDIAGFEIFEVNSFEQLCINMTNERLQQFFNHYCFTKEQEEYTRENIEWTYVDFALDLQATIDLIEKPLGILSLLDEESLFPQATDKSFISKLHSQHDNKNDRYSSVKLKPECFICKHYAGLVEYNTTNWLMKNKDPLNDNVTELFSRSTDKLLSNLFSDCKASIETPSSAVGSARKKGAQFVTVSQRHRKQLNTLMGLIEATHPHFVRCILPNNLKKPGIIDARLVLEQLRCNGVLEGIRICRLGYPSRVPFPDFRVRYTILAPRGLLPPGFMDSRVATEKIIRSLNLDPENFRIGSTKAFFKAGVLAGLEQRREDMLRETFSRIQALARGKLARRKFRRSRDQREAIVVIQRNVREYITLNQWSWWKLFKQVKPLLNVHRQDQRERELKDRIVEQQSSLELLGARKSELETIIVALEQQNGQLIEELNTERDTLSETIDALNRVEEKRNQIQEYSDEMRVKMDLLQNDYEKQNIDIAGLTKLLEQEKTACKKALEDLSEKTEESERLQDECSRLKRDLIEERSCWNREREEMKQKIAVISVELDERRTYAETVTSEKNGISVQLNRYKGEIEEITAKLAGREHELTANSNLIDTLRARVEQLEDEIANLELDNKKLNQETKSLSDTIATLNAKLSDDSAKLAAVQEAERKSEIAMSDLKMSFEKERGHLNQKISQEVLQKGTLQRERDQLQRKQSDLQQEIMQLQSALADLSQHKSSMTVELGNIRMSHADERESLTLTHRTEKRSLKNEIISLKEAVHQFELENKSLLSQNEIYQTNMQRLLQELEQTRELCDKLQNEARSSAAQLLHLEHQSVVDKSQIDHLTDQLNEVKKSHNATQLEIVALQGKQGEYAHEIDLIKNELKISNTNLQRKNDELIAAHEKVVTLESVLEEKETESALNKVKVTNLEQKLTSAVESHQKEIAQLIDAQTHAINKSRNQIAMVSAERDSLQERLKLVTDQLNALRATAEKWQQDQISINETAALESKIISFEKIIESNNVVLKEREKLIERLSEELNSSKDAFQNAEKDWNTEREKLIAKKDHDVQLIVNDVGKNFDENLLLDAKKRNNDLMHDLSVARAQIEELSTLNMSFKETADQLRNASKDILAKKDEEIRDLKNEYEKILDENRLSSSKDMKALQEARIEMENLKFRITEFESKFSAEQDGLTWLNDVKSRNQEIQLLQQLLDERQSTCEELEERCTKQRDRILALTEDLDSRLDSCATFESVQNALQKELQDVRVELSNETNLRLDLQRQKTVIERECERLRRTISEERALRDEIASGHANLLKAFSSERQRLMEDSSKIAMRLEETRRYWHAESEELRQQLEKCQHQLLVLRRKESASQRTIDELTLMLESEKKKRASLMKKAVKPEMELSKVSESSSIINKKQLEELDMLSNTVEELRSELSEEQQKNVRLQRESDTIRMHFETASSQRDFAMQRLENLNEQLKLLQNSSVLTNEKQSLNSPTGSPIADDVSDKQSITSKTARRVRSSPGNRDSDKVTAAKSRLEAKIKHLYESIDQQGSLPGNTEAIMREIQALQEQVDQAVKSSRATPSRRQVDYSSEYQRILSNFENKSAESDNEVVTLDAVKNILHDQLKGL